MVKQNKINWKNKEEVREYSLIYQRKWARNNPNYRKKYYEENKEKIDKRNKKWRLENPKKVKKWRLNNPEKIEKWTKENPEKFKECLKKYRRNNPEKEKAQRLANKYIKIPKNQLCEICKKKLTKDKHHPNYSKPLEVIFLCRKCHKELHKLLN